MSLTKFPQILLVAVENWASPAPHPRVYRETHPQIEQVL